jgi:hypothetical protein
MSYRWAMDGDEQAAQPFVMSLFQREGPTPQAWEGPVASAGWSPILRLPGNQKYLRGMHQNEAGGGCAWQAIRSPRRIPVRAARVESEGGERK